MPPPFLLTPPFQNKISVRLLLIIAKVNILEVSSGDAENAQVSANAGDPHAPGQAVIREINLVSFYKL